MCLQDSSRPRKGCGKAPAQWSTSLGTRGVGSFPRALVPSLPRRHVLGAKSEAAPVRTLAIGVVRDRNVGEERGWPHCSCGLSIRCKRTHNSAESRPMTWQSWFPGGSRFSCVVNCGSFSAPEGCPGSGSGMRHAVASALDRKTVDSGWLSGVAEAFWVALWLTMFPCAGSRGRFGDDWISMTMSVGRPRGRRSSARVSGQRAGAPCEPKYRFSIVLIRIMYRLAAISFARLIHKE
eukprot:scaffold6764_cov115-Isochrysis_galbana.AAC.7